MDEIIEIAEATARVAERNPGAYIDIMLDLYYALQEQKKND